MILPGTDYGKIFDVMTSEKEKVSYTIKKMVDEQRRTAKKTHRVVMHSVKRYINPSSRNTYIIWTNVRNGICAAESVLLLNDETGKPEIYHITKSLEVSRSLPAPQTVEWLNVYTPHFLARYRERTGKPTSMPLDELVARMIPEMTEMRTVPYYEDVCRREDDGSQFAHQVPEGVIFGTSRQCSTPTGRCFTVHRNNTFISQDMLTKSQTQHLLGKQTLEMVKNYSAILKKLNS